MKKWLTIPLAALLFAVPLVPEAAVNISTVSTASSHYKAINYLNKFHAFDYMGSRFNASAHVTRGQVAQVLYNVYSGKMKPKRSYKAFTDVAATHPHYKAIKWSYEVGVFDGSGASYNPNSAIRRDQLAKVLVSAFALPKKSSPIAFRDVAQDSFTESIHTLAAHRITIGDNGYFKPRQPVTSSQLASFIYRLATDDVSTTPPKTTTAATKAGYDTEYGFAWQIASKGVQLRLNGMDGAKKVAQYTAAAGDNIGGIVVGSSTKASVDSVYRTNVSAITRGNVSYRFVPTDEYSVLDIQGQYVYVFYDVHNGYKVRAMFVVNKQYEEQKTGFYGTQSASVLSHYNALMYELTNQARLAQGLSALTVAKADEVVAYNHSKDMQQNRYFSHTNLRGQSPLDRYNEQGSRQFSAVGEIIAMGQFNAIFAFEALHNSIGHRQNILHRSWTHMSISSYAGNAADMSKGAQPYFTQLFYY